MPKFERDVEINAPVEKVWEAMTDPNKWPLWFPGIENVTMSAPVSEGSTFEWTGKGQTGHGVVVKMDPQKCLEIMTQVGNDKDSHTFLLHPSGGFLGLNADECKVDYTLDTLMGGGILGSFIAGGNPEDLMHVKNTTNRLRQLVEGK